MVLASNKLDAGLSAPESELFGAVLISLPSHVRDELERQFVTARYPAGTVLIREGDPADRFCIVDTGEVEVWKTRRAGGSAAPVPAPGEPWEVPENEQTLLARMGSGSAFGEMALISDAPRSASIRATTDVEVRSLDARAFAHLLAADPSVALALETEVALRQATQALARSSPFRGQPPQLLRWLALRMTPVIVEAGADVIVEGDAADSFYVIRSGHLEVLGKRSDGSVYRVDEVGEGQAIGEQALIAGTRRTATIRALDRVELLWLASADFRAVLACYPDRARYMLLLSRQRQRPRPSPRVVVSEQVGAPGTHILKDTTTHRYMKLSDAGLFLWSLMDGERSVRDLSLEYFRRYQRFGVDIVIGLILDLHIAGFVEVPDIDPALALQLTPVGRVRRLILRLRPFVSRYFSIPNPDATFDWLYRVLLWPLFRPPAQIGLLLVALIGLGSFVKGVLSERPATGGVNTSEVLVFVIVGLELHVLLHECAHALTTKHFGREVHAAGIGWYLFSLVAFVDTSDMWLEGKRRRILVALAGPYTNFVLAGATALASTVVGPSALGVALFTLAADGYLVGLFNLNPLYEFDGYYALSDWLDVQNLRGKALAHLGAVVWRRPIRTSDRRLMTIFSLYGMSAVLYALIVACIVLLSYHRLLQDRVAEVMPVEIASAIGWLGSAIIPVLLLDNLIQSLRGRGQRV